MSKSARSTKKSAAQDPSQDLLKSLMDDIKMSEADLSQLTENPDSLSRTSQSKSHSMPDGLDLDAKVEELTTSMLVPGMRNEDGEGEDDLAILLDQNFNDATQFSQIIPSDKTKFQPMPARIQPETHHEKSEVRNDSDELQVLGINEPTVFAKSQNELGQASPMQVLTDRLARENQDLALPNDVLEIPSLPDQDLKVDFPHEVMPSAESLFRSLGADLGKGLTEFRDRVEQIFPETGVSNVSDKTVALSTKREPPPSNTSSFSISDKTVAVAGFSDRHDAKIEDKVKVSIGEVRASSPLASWGRADSNIGIAHNLELAQEKILRLEQENGVLRSQNDELVAAAEVIKERADLLANELSLLKQDRDSLDQSFKNELLLMKNQISRKDSEYERIAGKAEELESMLKFDMKKIRVRERELENRLELLRSEKNALVKSKDEMILDLRRKCDQFQLETESFRQKCIELNKVIESSQDSVKRTTRALRLAMANLEVQDENKQNLKKAD